MIRSVFAATLVAAMLAGPAVVLAQTDMVTYGDTLRKGSGAHSAVQPVRHGTVGAKHAGAMHAGGGHSAAKAHRRK